MSADFSMPASDWVVLEQFLDSFEFKGERYPEAILKLVDRTPD
jgi:hypothetical protein